jgi:lauroyl/myristoyl acyltransferase
MRKLKRMVAGLFLNLYLGLLNFVLYPILLLLLPSRIPEWVMKFQGDLTYFFSKKQRLKVTRILREKIPAAKDEKRAKRIARDYFRIQASFFYYTLFILAFRLKKWLPRFVTYEGLEHLDSSLKPDQGVIMPTFHFNHPIATPGFLVFKKYKVTGYAVHPWDLNVPWVVKINTWLGYNVGMLKGDLQMAYMRRGAREVYLRRLNEGGVFVVLIDIPFLEKKDLKPMEFLGERFLFPSRVMDVIYETGCPVHIAYCVRDNKDWRRAKVTVSPRIPMTGDPDRDLQTILRAHEAAVTQHPEQWWGWMRYERGTLAYREEYRRRKEQVRQGKDQGGRQNT